MFENETLRANRYSHGDLPRYPESDRQARRREKNPAASLRRSSLPARRGSGIACVGAVSLAHFELKRGIAADFSRKLQERKEPLPAPQGGLYAARLVYWK